MAKQSRRDFTKSALAAISALTAGRSALVVLERGDETAWKSLRNAADVHVLAVDQLNTYDVLVNDDTVFTAGALEAFVAGPAKGKQAKAVATESEVEEARDDADQQKPPRRTHPSHRVGEELLAHGRGQVHL